MKQEIIKYRFLILIAVLIPSIYIISSLLTAILLSVVFAYLIRPVANKVEGYTNVRDTAVFIAILIVITPVILGIIIAGYQLSNELSKFSGQIGGINYISESSIINYFSKYTSANNVEYILQQLKTTASNFAKSLPEKTLSLPHYLIQIILIPFLTFYLVNDRHLISQQVMVLSNDAVWKKLIKKIDNNFYGIFMGHFFVSVIAGVIATIGFLILGIPYAIILGFLATIAALLPIIGASTIAFLVCGIYLLEGEYIKAAEVLVFTILFLIIFIDFVVRPRVVSATSKIHPMIVILGFTGGPLVFGISGFVLGPAILGAAKAVVEVLNEEMEEGNKECVRQFKENLKI